MTRVLLLAAVAALAAAPPALAKRTRLQVVAPAAHVSRPWTPRIVVSMDGHPFAPRWWRPRLALLDGEGAVVRTFVGRKTSPTAYTVRVVFPHAGRWRYSVADPIVGDWFFTVRVAA